MADDRIFGSEEFIETIIVGDGSSDIVGFRAALLAQFPQKTATLQVVPWWPYQQNTSFPDKFPTIALFWIQPSSEVSFFHRHKSPSDSTKLVWATERTIQINFFGRTRPEMSELFDFCNRHVKIQGSKMWDKYRVRYGETEDTGMVERNPNLSAFFTFFRFRVTLPSLANLT